MHPEQRAPAVPNAPRAFFAAALSSIAGAGGFERKWRANRLSRAELDALKIDLADPSMDLKEARAELKQIIRVHDREVLGVTGK